MRSKLSNLNLLFIFFLLALISWAFLTNIKCPNPAINACVEEAKFLTNLNSNLSTDQYLNIWSTNYSLPKILIVVSVIISLFAVLIINYLLKINFSIIMLAYFATMQNYYYSFYILTLLGVLSGILIVFALIMHFASNKNIFATSSIKETPKLRFLNFSLLSLLTSTVLNFADFFPKFMMTPEAIIFYLSVTLLIFFYILLSVKLAYFITKDASNEVSIFFFGIPLKKIPSNDYQQFGNQIILGNEKFYLHKS